MKETMIENAPLFAELTVEQRDLIACRMTLETRRPGDTLFAQGQPASAMYLVKSGRVRLINDQFEVLANLGPGSMLGEVDALASQSHTLSAEAATAVELWTLSTMDLAGLMAQDSEIGRRLKQAAGVAEDQFTERHLRRLPLMKGLTREQIGEVASHLRPEHFTAGQAFYHRGEPGDALYLIETGQVAVQAHVGGGLVHTLAMLGPGEFFGETALLTAEPHATDAIAQTEVQTWSLNRTDFEALVLRFPTLALNLSRLLSQRLRESTERVVAGVAAFPASVPGAYAIPTEAQIRRTADVSGMAMGVGRAANAATRWFATASIGAKLRLAAMILLLIYVLGVAVPLLVIRSLTSGPVPLPQATNAVARASIRDRVVQIALAADLPVQTTPTYTPWPTETPIPTPTFTPTPTPTNTPIPTPTFTPTATPIPPTATPVPTPVQAVVQEAAPAVAAAAAAPPPEPTRPSVQFKLIEMRRLSPCENRGNHHIFIRVVDPGGNPVDGVTLVQVPAGQPGNVLDKTISGTKGPGKAEFVMWKGAQYGVYVTQDGANPASTDIAQPLHPNFTDEAICGDGQGGNTLFHNSFSVVFQKTF